MSNIHGFGDDNNNEQNQRHYYRPQFFAAGEDNDNNNNNQQGEQTDGVRAMRDYLYKYNESNPRNENFYSFLKSSMCPVFTFKSVTFGLFAVNIILYIVTLCFGLDIRSQRASAFFLCPKTETLKKFGALGYNLILDKPSQLFRLVTNFFLHSCFIQVVSNTIVSLIFLTLIEKLYVWWKFLLIYVLTGIFGSLIYVMTCPNNDRDIITVGSSLCLFGMFGSYFAYWFINYNSLSNALAPNERCCLLNMICTVFFIVFFIQMLQSIMSHNYRNILAHLLGLLFGFFWTFIICQPEVPNSTACFDYKVWLIASCVVCGGCLVGGIIFFSLKYTKKNN